MLHFPAKVLVSSGTPRGNEQNSEIIDLYDHTFRHELKLSDVSRSKGAVGALLNNQPLICGGSAQNTKCTVVGKPSLSIKLIQPRSYAASVVLPDQCLWIVGGDDGNFPLSSTEFVYIDKPSKAGPELPFSIKKHGIVLIEKVVYIIGGWQGRVNSNHKVWIVDLLNDFSISEGPSLNVPRFGHTCGKMVINGSTLIVVAGGSDGSNCLDSVEILEYGSDQWIQGSTNTLIIEIEVS